MAVIAAVQDSTTPRIRLIVHHNVSPNLVAPEEKQKRLIGELLLAVRKKHTHHRGHRGRSTCIPTTTERM